ncbi:MAG: hypothetical protein Pyrs2KO_20940 [Pyruvatibacter sp.]
MQNSCADCKHFIDGLRGDYGMCSWSPPANLAKALGLTSKYDMPDAETHRDHGCSLIEAEDRFI